MRCARALARVHWRYPNEQFAYLAQRTVGARRDALARDAVRLTGLPRLALAGGVVSNVKATRRVRLLPEVDDVFVFPHMGDGGLALGAAIAARGRRRARRSQLDLDRLDLGPAYDRGGDRGEPARGWPSVDVRRASRRAGSPNCSTRRPVVMWFQGAMEYGPRALGCRSVLARPDRVDLRDRLNLVLKRRVWYQPFCPSMLESDAIRVLADWTGGRNRAMTMAYKVADATAIGSPA